LDFFWLTTVLEVIDLRAFSTVWYWLALAALWTAATHWIVGVPYDIVRRAIRGDGQAAADLDVLARLHARRLSAAWAGAGWPPVAAASFGLTVVATLGFGYGLELAQGAFLLLLPAAGVAWLNLATARRIEGADLVTIVHLLHRHRRIVQLTAASSILLTSMWGMWVNLTASVL
jgi:hypothetical protein